MSGAILPLPQYPFVAWCSVKKLIIHSVVSCAHYEFERSELAASLFRSFFYLSAINCHSSSVLFDSDHTRYQHWFLCMIKSGLFVIPTEREQQATVMTTYSGKHHLPTGG
jgi:hypothetical protein